MTYQAIAFDLDGTLLNSQGQILESSKNVIRHVRERGIKVVFVTGRHHTAVKPYYYELNLDTPIICCNGTYIYQPQTDEVLISNPLSKAQSEKVITLAEQHDIDLLMYSRDAMNYSRLNPHMEKFTRWVASCPQEVRPNVKQMDDFRALLDNPNEVVWKFVVSHPDRHVMETVVAALPTNEFSSEWSWIDRVDVANQGNSKGGRLLELLKIWNIDPQYVISFGDNHNDSSMISAVGMGIAMGNAEQEVKSIAKRVTLSNDENGIEKALEELFQ